MRRYWLLTWTTYGTWLPGDDRGFVSNVRVGPGPEVRHNTPGTPIDRNMPGLRAAAQARLQGDPVVLNREQAAAVVEQLKETAAHRGWELLAVAVMWNHVHLVVSVPGDPDPAVLLRDFKSYAARRLNKRWGKPASGTWWTESGSRRILRDEEAVAAAVDYVVSRQPNPLVTWSAMTPAERVGERERASRDKATEGPANEGRASGGREPPDGPPGFNDPASGGREPPDGPPGFNDPASGGRKPPDGPPGQRLGEESGG